MKRKINIIGLTLFFTLTLFSFVFSEENITITTYYPSPYGSYNELRFYPHSPATTSCSSGQEGLMYYDSGIRTLQVCGWTGTTYAWQGLGVWAVSGNNIYNTNTGNVGIGTTGPNTRLEVDGAIFSVGTGGGEFIMGNSAINPTWHLDYAYGAGGGDNLRIFRQPNLTTPGTEFVIINSTGNVGIGTANPLEKLEVNGNLRVNGILLQGTMTATSSKEFKTAITYLQSADYANILRKIDETRIATYRFKQAEMDQKRHIGVIAEEAPEDIVTVDRKGINYSDYLGFLLAAIKAQNQELQALKAELASLKASVAEERFGVTSGAQSDWRESP